MRRIYCILILIICFVLTSCSSSWQELNLEPCSSYENSIVSFLGDSITEFSNDDNGFIQRLNKHFKFKKYNNLGISGTTLSNTSLYNAFFQDERISSIPKETDILFVFGGINDCGRNYPIGEISLDNTNCDTVIGGCNVLINKVKEKYEVEIIFIIPHYFITDNSQLYTESIKKIVEMNGLKFIDLYNESGITNENYKSFSPDGVHLNAKGNYMVAQCIGKKMIEWKDELSE